MKTVPAALVALLFTVASAAAANNIEIRKSSPQAKTIDIRFEASLAAVVEALSIHIGAPVDYATSDRVVIRYAKRGVAPVVALRDIVEQSGYVLLQRGDRYEIRNPDEPLVSIDVQDADVRSVLLALKSQCGIANMVIDRDVQGKSTLLLRDVPCSTAFRIVFNSSGLNGELQSNSVMIVGARK